MFMSMCTYHHVCLCQTHAHTSFEIKLCVHVSLCKLTQTLWASVYRDICVCIHFYVCAFWGSCSKKVSLSKNSVRLCNEDISPVVWPYFKVLPNPWSAERKISDVCGNASLIHVCDVYSTYLYTSIGFHVCVRLCSCSIFTLLAFTRLSVITFKIQQ